MLSQLWSDFSFLLFYFKGEPGGSLHYIFKQLVYFFQNIGSEFKSLSERPDTRPISHHHTSCIFSAIRAINSYPLPYPRYLCFRNLYLLRFQGCFIYICVCVCVLFFSLSRENNIKRFFCFYWCIFIKYQVTFFNLNQSKTIPKGSVREKMKAGIGLGRKMNFFNRYSFHFYLIRL